MSFPRYPKYKDSGVEWLGEVPEHWHTCSFRHCLSEVFNGLTSTQVDEAEGTVPVTRIETISAGTIDETRLGYIRADDAREDRRLRYGDILFSNINSLNMIGNCALYAGGREIFAGMNLLVLRPSTQTNCKWLYWLVRSPVFREVIESLAKPAINQASISQASINSIIVPVPSETEQATTAAFLDRETAKVDALVAEQRRLIELLKEKRQAVISHAVTKGLNPDARMKPSGIEWLGDVPEGWAIKRLKRLVFASRKITYGIVQPGESDPTGPYMIRGKDYSNGWCQPGEIFRVSNAIETPYARSRVKVNDLVMTIVGAGVGNVALIPDWLDGANITQTTARIAIDSSKAESAFVYFALQGIIGQRNLERNVYGSAQPRLNIEHVDSYLMTVPPIEEQRQIVTYLSQVLDRFEVMTFEAQRGIDLLQERRTALISAAVTGKIDVRGLAETEAA